MTQRPAIETAEPKTRRWTRDEYHRMADMGMFRNQRVELLGGEVIQQPRQQDAHVIAVALSADAAASAFGEVYWVRIKAPLNIDRYNEPEPDVTAVRDSPRDYVGADNRADALLIVEVSDTTLTYDRTRKARRYARAGVADYWIVNLVARQLEVRRDPQRVGRRFRYTSLTIHTAEDSVAPLAAPAAPIRVADLLP